MDSCYNEKYLYLWQASITTLFIGNLDLSWYNIKCLFQLSRFIYTNICIHSLNSELWEFLCCVWRVKIGCYNEVNQYMKIRKYENDVSVFIYYTNPVINQSINQSTRKFCILFLFVNSYFVLDLSYQLSI